MAATARDLRAPCPRHKFSDMHRFASKPMAASVAPGVKCATTGRCEALSEIAKPQRNLTSISGRTGLRFLHRLRTA